MKRSNIKVAFFQFHTSPPVIQGQAAKIILGILAVIILIVAFFYYFTNSLPRDAHAQLDAIKSGHIEAAYAMTTKEFQKAVSFETFKSTIADHPILKDFTNVKFTESKIENGLGYATGTIEDKNKDVMKIEYQFIKEDGQWKIQAFRVTKPE